MIPVLGHGAAHRAPAEATGEGVSGELCTFSDGTETRAECVTQGSEMCCSLSSENRESLSHMFQSHSASRRPPEPGGYTLCRSREQSGGH